MQVGEHVKRKDAKNQGLIRIRDWKNESLK
jgi:hypothetical protein